MRSTTLRRSAAVVNELLGRFGEARVGCVQQLSDNCYRAHLLTGEIALAVVAEDGSVIIKEPEVSA